MHKHVVRCLASAKTEHGGPEQGVEGDDVFADEVVLLCLVVGHVLFKTAVVRIFSAVLGTTLVEPVLQRGQVAHGRIQPHIEVLARRPID